MDSTVVSEQTIRRGTANFYEGWTHVNFPAPILREFEVGNGTLFHHYIIYDIIGLPSVDLDFETDS